MSTTWQQVNEGAAAAVSRVSGAIESERQRTEAEFLRVNRDGTSLVADGVPPGAYYVRVRAINYVGRSVAVELPIVVR